MKRKLEQQIICLYDMHTHAHTSTLTQQRQVPIRNVNKKEVEEAKNNFEIDATSFQHTAIISAQTQFIRVVANSHYCIHILFHYM